MGLAERQMLADIKDKRIPYHEKSIEEAVGKRIPIEVAWDTLESDSEAIKFFDSTALGELVASIRKVARKPLGKEALTEKVTTIHITHISDPTAKGLRLEDGILKLQAKWGKEFADRIGEAELVKLMDEIL